MSKELDRAIVILEELLALPKGKNEDIINLGLRIGINSMKVEITNKRITELNKEIESLKKETESQE